jgi:hypothetical protein
MASASLAHTEHEEPGGVDDELELMGLDDDGTRDGLEDLPGPGAAARPTGGPVLLTLTTREQVEQAAAAEAAPKMIRVRPGRGAFGGLASGGGCANPHR